MKDTFSCAQQELLPAAFCDYCFWLSFHSISLRNTLLHDCPSGSWSQLEPFWAFYSQQKCQTLCYRRSKWITNKQAALPLARPHHFITKHYHVHRVQFARGKSMLFLVIFLPFMCLKMVPMKTSVIIFPGLRWGQPACCTPDVSVHLRPQLDTSGSDFYFMHNPWEKWHCFIWSVITWDYNHLTTFANNSKHRRSGNISSLITHSIVCLAQSFFLYFFRKLPSPTDTSLQASPLKKKKKKN